MNKEQFNKLQKFEKNFETILKSNFTRNIAINDRKTIAEVYKEIKKVNNAGNIGCSSCFEQVLKYIAPIYLKYKEKNEEKNELKNIENGSAERE